MVDIELSVEVFLESEVQGRSREVSHHVGGVASPERQYAFFCHDSSEAVHYAFVLSVLQEMVRTLGLKKEFHSFYGSAHGSGNDAGDSANPKVYPDITLTHPVSFIFSLNSFNLKIS